MSTHSHNGIVATSEAEAGVYGYGVYGGEFGVNNPAVLASAQGNLLLPPACYSDDTPTDSASQGSLRMIEVQTGGDSGKSFAWIKMTAGANGWQKVSMV